MNPTVSEHKNPSPLDLIGIVLGDYCSRDTALTGQNFDAIRAVVSSWNQANRRLHEENRDFGTGFNPLSLIPLKETIHSRIIGDFLNPKGSHGQGNLFLQGFPREIGLEAFPEGWKLTVESGWVDIMLWRDSACGHSREHAILIENKSNEAGDRLNQIYRYWHEQIYLRNGAETDYASPDIRGRFKLIYLPVDDSKQPAAHSMTRPADWELKNPHHEKVPLELEVISIPRLLSVWREAAAKIPQGNSRLRAFFEFYDEHWNP